MTTALSQKLAHLKAGMAQGRHLDSEHVLNLFEDVEALLFDLDVRVKRIEGIKAVTPPPYVEPRGK
jgi:hypothetical protein